MTNYFAHETAIIDAGANIADGTKIWHFSHIMANCEIGANCNIGQNCVISPEVILGSNVKVQNNVSIYTGVCCEEDVFLGPSMVFTNVTNPRSGVNRRGQYSKTLVRKGASRAHILFFVRWIVSRAFWSLRERGRRVLRSRCAGGTTSYHVQARTS